VRSKIVKVPLINRDRRITLGYLVWAIAISYLGALPN
jgi:hypothetical protein